MCESSAYHEAGHAFMAAYVGAELKLVTIEPNRDDGPQRHGDTQVQWRISQFSEPELCEKMALVALAGPVAEMIYTGEPYHPGLVAEWSGDWQEAWRAAALCYPDERKRLQYLEQTVRDLYRRLNETRCWAALAAVADNLLAHETLEGEQVEEVMRAWLA